MTDPANDRPEAAEERATALLADAARAAHSRSHGAEMSLAALIQPDHFRLSEIERVTIRRMVKALFESVERELRARLLTQPDLPDLPEFTASLGAAHVAIAWPILSLAGLPDDSRLAALLIRQGKSFGIVRNLRQDALTMENGRLDVLPQHGDAEIAGDAMKFLIAESRLNDRFDDPRLVRADLPEHVDTQLLWTVAAALRDYGVSNFGIDGVQLDAILSRTVTAMLADERATLSIDIIAMALAKKMEAADMVDDQLLVEALSSARFSLFVALVAVRAGLSFEIALEMAAMPDAPSHMLLLKAIDVHRDSASHLVMTMTRAVLADDRAADEQAASWMQAYDSLTSAAIDRAMRPWRLDGAYRSALARLAAVSDGLSA